MSDYKRVTKHPVTGEFKEAIWLDNYFGRYSYGVRFSGEFTVFKADDYKWETLAEKRAEVAELHRGVLAAYEFSKTYPWKPWRPEADVRKATDAAKEQR